MKRILVHLSEKQPNAVQCAIEDIEAECGAMAEDCKPFHVGNFQFDFSRVPSAVVAEMIVVLRRNGSFKLAETLKDSVIRSVLSE